MYKIKPFLLILVILIASIQPTASQNNTNSPYTMYGYGEISNNTSGEQRAMGGVAIGARSKHRINTVNPASYSVSDSLTFMLDLGASGLLSGFTDDASRRKNSFNANLEYLTMQFRLYKGLGLSIGLLPYSFAGYNFYKTDSVSMPPSGSDDPEQHKYTASHTGTGGFSQIYLGLGADLFNHLSLGANMYYMFGSYNNNNILTFANTNDESRNETNAIRANSLRFRFGAQLYNTFAEKHDFTLGMIYEPKMALNADATRTTVAHSEEVEDISKGFELPQIFGGGIFYKYDNKISIGFDYSFIQWSDILFYDKKNELVNQSKFALGAEYQPNFRSRKYRDQIMYRFGLNTSNPYFKMNGNDMGQNFGITFGIGLPLRSSSRTMINMALEYGKVGSTTKLREDYFKFTFNFALAETWFFKRKL